MVECQSPVTDMVGCLRAWGTLHTPTKVHRPWPMSQNWAGYRTESAREILKNPDPWVLYLGISGRDLIWCLVICVLLNSSRWFWYAVKFGYQHTWDKVGREFIGPNLTRYMVCAQNCLSCHGCTEGGATLKGFRVCLRDETKRSKASRVQDLVWAEAKGREGWTHQRRPHGHDQWSGAIGGY